MRKYALLRERVASLAPDRIRMAEPATDDELACAHDPAYVAAVETGALDLHAQRRIGFPWSRAMAERSRRSAGATLAACRSALHHGCGVHLAGGTHHAHHDFGEGFCVFNDAAIATRALRAEASIGRALVVDLDVHQGDGTAAILADDEPLWTLSVHGRNNFPFRKRQSRLDVELDDGTGDHAYLATLRAVLPVAFEHARPNLVLYIAGADPFEGDRYGRLALTKEGLAARDRYVFAQCQGHGVPVAVVMGGGYADRIEDVVDIHERTVKTALEFFAATRMLDSSKAAISQAAALPTNLHADSTPEWR